MILFRSLLILSLCWLAILSHGQFTPMNGIGADASAVHYKSDGLIWVGGDDLMWRSTDHGGTFSTINPIDPVYWMGEIIGNTTGIFGFSSTHAFMVGDYYLPNNAIIYENTTGGSNWDVAYIDNLNFNPNRLTTDIAYDDNGHFVVTGSQGRIIISSNSGADWTLVSSGTTQDIMEVVFVGNNTWIAVGDGFALRSTNNGISWSSLSVNNAFESAITSNQNGVVYIYSSEGLIKSSDYGVTWQIVSGVIPSASAIQLISPDMVLIAGSEDLYVSYNSGQVWESLNIPNYLTPITDFSFYDASHGVAISNSSFALKTSNGIGASYPIPFLDVPSIACSDMLVHFSNQTNGNYTYEWLVNDVLVGSGVEMDFTFPNAGTYTVTLKAYNSNGFGTSSMEILVFDTPTFEIEEIILSADTVCPNSNITVSVPNSISGVVYKLYRGNTQLGSTLTGNNGVITFNTNAANPSSGPSTYDVLKVVGAKTNSCTTYYTELYDSLFIIRPSIYTQPFVPIDTICYNRGLVAGVLNSEPGYKYNFYRSNSTFGPIYGNGDTVLYEFDNFVSGTYSFTFRAINMEYGCTYSGYPIISFTNQSTTGVITVSPSIAFVGTPIVLNNTMGYTHYNWDFGDLSSNQETSTLKNPPPLIFNESGRDSVRIYFQMDADNSCNGVVYKIIDVIAPIEDNFTVCANNVQTNLRAVKSVVLSGGDSWVLAQRKIGNINKLSLLHYDPSGIVISEMSPPNQSDVSSVELRDFEISEDGEFWISGYAAMTVNLFEHNVKGYFLIKLNQDLNYVWHIQSTNANWFNFQLVDGQAILVGTHTNGLNISQSNGQAYIAQTALAAKGGPAFIVTIDESGYVVHHCYLFNKLANAQGAVSPAGIFTGSPIKIEIASSGDVWVSAMYYSFSPSEILFADGIVAEKKYGNDVLYSSENLSLVVVRYRKGEGVIRAFIPFLMDEAYLPGGISQYSAFTELSNGDFLFGGSCSDLIYSSSVSTRFNLTFNNSLRTFFTIKTDSLGNEIWRNLSQTESNWQFLPLDQGGFAAFSLHNNFITLTDPQLNAFGQVVQGESDLAFAIHSGDGHLMEMKALGSPNADVPISVGKDGCGNYRLIWLSNLASYAGAVTGNIQDGTGLNSTVLNTNACQFCVDQSGELAMDIGITDLRIIPNDPLIGGERSFVGAIYNAGFDTITNPQFDVRIDGTLYEVTVDAEILPADTLHDFSFISLVPLQQVGHAFSIGVDENYLLNDFNEENNYEEMGFVTCIGPLSGEYDVGPNGDFLGLSDVLLALDTCGIANSVIFNLEPGIYDGYLTIQTIAGLGGANSVTFRSATGNAGDVVVKKPDNIILGINTAMLTIKPFLVNLFFENLTFERSNALDDGNTINFGSYCTDLKFINCVFKGIYNARYQNHLQGPNTADRIVIEGNTFENGARSIRLSTYIHPLNEPETSADVEIRNNHFTNPSRRCLDLYNQEQLKITGNYFSGYVPNESLVTIVAGQSDFEIVNNIIDLQGYSFGNYATSGITNEDLSALFYLYNIPYTSNSRAIIANNIVQYKNLSADNTFHFNNANGVDLVHNSLIGSVYTYASSNLSIQNNLFVQGKNDFFIRYYPGENFIIDYNQYDQSYETALSTYPYRYCASGCTPMTFTTWQSASGMDMHSEESFSTILGNYDLKLGNVGFTGSADVAALVPLDIDGETRSQVEPQVGADEFIINHLSIYLSDETFVTCANLAGGSYHAEGLGGQSPYTYLWEDGSTEPLRTGLMAGEYSLTVTDAQGETVSRNFVMPSPPNFDVNIIPHYYCGEVLLSYDITGTPANYSSWIASLNGNIVNDHTNVNSDGLFVMTITDVNGCIAQDSLLLEISKITIDTVSVVQMGCDTEGFIDIEVVNGYDEVYYNWTPYANTQDLVVSEGGLYSLIAVNENGCIAYFDTLMLQSLVLDAQNLTGCFNGENGNIVATIEGDYTIQYSWNNGANSLELQNLGAGTYTITATDAYGCSLSETITIENIVSCGCSGDVDEDGVVGIADLMELINNLGCAIGCPGDEDGNGIVSVSDLMILIANYNNICGQ